MKKKLFSKVSAAIIAVLTVSAMAIPTVNVFAADTPTINVSPANKLVSSASSVDVTVKKDIVLFNVDESPILSPNIAYSYEITSAAVTTATISTYAPEDLDTDGKTPKSGATPISVTVKPGPIDAIRVGSNTASNNKVAGTISFGNSSDKNVDSDTVNDNETKHATNDEYGTNTNVNIDLSKKVTSSMTVTVDASKIYDTDNDSKQNNAPGVYRYKIEDITTEDTLKASGITRNYKDAAGNHDKYIYLDVYTKYNSNNTGLEIYGYVLLKDTTNGDNESLTYTKSNDKDTIKITGFDTDSENDEKFGESSVTAGNLTSDSYHTYNVKVSKQVDGALADTQHNFPFKIELSNTGTGAITSQDDFYYIIKKDGTEITANNPSLGTGKLADTEKAAFLGTNGSWTLDGTTDTALQLQYNDYIEIIGLPQNTKIKVTETNDTADTYSVSATNLKQPTGTGTDDITLKSGENTGTSLSVASNATAEMNTALDVKKTDAGDKIEFTNTLKDISVTGLLFNVAPFAFITIAGGILIGVSMKNKKRTETDDII